MGSLFPFPPTKPPAAIKTKGMQNWTRARGPGAMKSPGSQSGPDGSLGCGGGCWQPALLKNNIVFLSEDGFIGTE